MAMKRCWQAVHKPSELEGVSVVRLGPMTPQEYADELDIQLSLLVGTARQVNELDLAFSPGRELVGRLSANPPMRWHVEFDPKAGSFSISGSSPGPQKTPEYERQEKINNRLGGKVLALYTSEWSAEARGLCDYALRRGFEPQSIILSEAEFGALIREVGDQSLWDAREERRSQSTLLAASALGFRWLSSPADFEATFQYLPASKSKANGNGQ
jgi:hypothetical protein